jgi:hypothetical protein
VWAWPRRIGVTARICSVCFCGVDPSLEQLLAASFYQVLDALTCLRSRSNPDLPLLHLDHRDLLPQAGKVEAAIQHHLLLSWPLHLVACPRSSSFRLWPPRDYVP